VNTGPVALFAGFIFSHFTLPKWLCDYIMAFFLVTTVLLPLMAHNLTAIPCRPKNRESYLASQMHFWWVSVPKSFSAPTTVKLLCLCALICRVSRAQQTEIKGYENQYCADFNHHRCWKVLLGFSLNHQIQYIIYVYMGANASCVQLMTERIQYLLRKSFFLYLMLLLKLEM